MASQSSLSRAGGISTPSAAPGLAPPPAMSGLREEKVVELPEACPLVPGSAGRIADVVAATENRFASVPERSEDGEEQCRPNALALVPGSDEQQVEHGGTLSADERGTDDCRRIVLGDGDPARAVEWTSAAGEDAADALTREVGELVGRVVAELDRRLERLEKSVEDGGFVINHDWTDPRRIVARVGWDLGLYENVPLARADPGHAVDVLVLPSELLEGEMELVDRHRNAFAPHWHRGLFQYPSEYLRGATRRWLHSRLCGFDAARRMDRFPPALCLLRLEPILIGCSVHRSALEAVAGQC